MAVIFTGSELDSFELVGTGQRTTTTAALFDSDFCRSAMEHGGGAISNGLKKTFTPASEYWIHCNVAFELIGSSMDLSFIHAEDFAAGVTIFKMEGNNGTFFGNYWNGASFTAMSNSWTPTADTVYKIDIHINIHDTTGRFAIYIDDVLHEEFTGDTLLYTTPAMDGILLRGATTTLNYAQSSSFSEVIVADESTVGWRVATIVPTGAGATGAWTGLWSDVDEVTIDDTDWLESNTNAQVETMVASNLSVAAAAMDVQALAVVARARKGGSGIQQIQMALRTNATDYYSSTLALDPGFIPIDNLWLTNPDTAAQWTPAEIDAIEIGVKSIT